MWGYRRGYAWEPDLADALVGGIMTIVLAVILILAAIILTLVIALALELFRIFRRHAGGQTMGVRVLWGATIGFLGLVLLALLAPGAAMLGAMAWGFLGLAAVAEAVDWHAERHLLR